MNIYHISELEPDSSTFGTPIKIKQEPELIIGDNVEYNASDDPPLKKLKSKNDSDSSLSENTDSNTESILSIKEEPLEVDDELTEFHNPSDNEESSTTKFIRQIDTCEADEFKRLFHMRRETVNYLIELYKSSVEFKQIKAKVINQAKVEVYIFIWYLITNHHFPTISTLFEVPRYKIALILNRVTYFLIHVGHNYVKWPTMGNSYGEISGNISRLKSGSGIIGTIECTLIKFPGYFQHKKMRGVYLQLVIDQDGYFVDVCCGEYSYYNIRDVLRCSSLYYRATQNENDTFPDNTFIIGSTAYPSLNWLVTPFQGNLTDIQEQFNKIHSIKRMMAETIVGGLKARFRVLQGFKQKNRCSVVNISVCVCILHNICVQKNDLWEGDFEPHKTVYIGKEWPTDVDPVRDRRQKYLELLIDNQQHNPLK